MIHRARVVGVLAASFPLAVASVSGAASAPDEPSPEAELPDLAAFGLLDLSLPESLGRRITPTVSVDGQDYTLDLRPHSVRAHDFRLLVDPGTGQLVETPAPAPRTYRGVVEGTDTPVAASLIDRQLWATIYLPGRTITVEPLNQFELDAPASMHVVYTSDDVLPARKGCGVIDGFDPGDLGHLDARGDAVPVGGGLRVVDLGCDTDVEYWIDNGSSVDATLFDVENVINSMEVIWETQVSLTFEITTIIVRTGPTDGDPYSSSICGSLLNQFGGTWNSSPEVNIRRDVAQLFTGRNLSDCLGIAATPSACNIPSAYSLVESKAPGLGFQSRLALSAHELGHTFNALHCCGSCAGCGGCQIMCPCIGGCSGNVTAFNATSVNAITNYTNSGAGNCIGDLAPGPLALPFFDDFETFTLDPTRWTYVQGVNGLSNGVNEPSGVRSAELDAFSSSQYADDQIRSNTIDLSGLGNVFVSYWTEHRGVPATEALVVEFWGNDLRWHELERIESDGTDQDDYVFSQHQLDLVPTAFHSEFRLRFRVEVSGPSSNWYLDDVTIEQLPAPVNDDCATALPIGNETVGFTTIGASTDGAAHQCAGGAPVSFVNDVWYVYSPSCIGTLTATTCNDADYDTRIAIYNGTNCIPLTPLACSDNAAGCGDTSTAQALVVPGSDVLIRVGGTVGPGTGNLTVSCAPLVNCPEDLDGDNSVGTSDLLQLLGTWGPCPGCPEDLDGDDNVGTSDLLQLLSAWGGC